MSTHLTTQGQIVKWVVIPALLIAVGYFLIGPRIGRRNLPPTPPAPPEISIKPSPEASPNPPPDAPVPNSADTTEKPKRRRRKKSKAQPQNSVSLSSDNYPQAPPPDQGETGSESETSH